MAALLAGAATAADGQEPGDPPPPQPPTTTVVEPIAEPDSPPGEPPAEPAPEIAHVPPNAGGIPLSTLETRNFSLLYFDPVQTYLTPYLGRSIENALAWHRQRFNWRPWDRTNVLLKDFGDYGNAAARSSPNNAVLFDVAPLSQNMETFTPGERFFTLTNHELAHVATMDVWNRSDAFWRRVFFGKPMPIQEHPESILYNFLATPRNAVPRWWLEGSAVFFETWMAGGLGRAQGAYDEMVWRAKVRDNDKIYSPLGLESEGTAVDFQVGVNDYLYGTRFFSWLALTYGPDKVVQWLRRDEGSKAYYAAAFRQTFGLRLDDAWNDWIAFERGFQKEQLAKLAAFPLTEVTRLSPRGLGSISRGFVDSKTNRLVAAFRYPGKIGFVGTMDLATGELRPLQEIKGMMLYKVTSLAFDEQARKAYYTEDNYAFRDIVEVDVDTGRKTMLLRDARIGDLVLNPQDRSLWGIRHQNGFATIVRLPPPYTAFNQIHTFGYGQIPFDLDISPDGRMVAASFGEINGDQSVRVWSMDSLLADGDPQEVARLSLPPSTPEGFVFTPDGKALIGTSYYTGVSNVFRFDIASQKYEVLSNAETGFFRPLPQPDGSLLVYEYTGEGLTPARIVPKPTDDLGTIEFLGTRVVNTHPVLKTWGVGSPARVPLDELVTERGRYNATRRMKLAAAYPILEGYKGHYSPGYFIHFEDPMQFHQFDATISYSPFGNVPGRERLHLALAYKTLEWKLQYLHNKADFYDLFGPVERSRKGDAFIIGWKKTTLYDPPRTLEFFWNAAAYLGLEQLPASQNVSSPRNILSTDAGIRYSNTRKSLGGVDHEKGIAWRTTVGLDHAEGDSFPRFAAELDYGVPLPWPNASVWGYASAGVIAGKKDSPLGSFYFGSFRNNYVDNRPEKRYRELEAFPGFEIDQIDARRFAKLIGEVNLPPLRFAEVGTPSIYLSYARPALFAGTMLTHDSVGKNHNYLTFGGQVDLAFTVALRLPMVFSIGAARGFADGEAEKTEYMFSLKIM
ncbi:MAG TPA: hypothetical protein VNJ05_08495 [Sphingomicrobium sp.]|nr:hypothetical protein [Sphingomicrobium sp.]